MTKDFVTIIREENQRLRIERIGFISRIEELQAEVARLKNEHTELTAAISALPTRPSRTTANG
jgi:hypothetical protein